MLELPSRGEVQVEMLDRPSPAPEGKVIHRRMPLPQVPTKRNSGTDYE
ncbi:MAG: hypothetical protein ABI705_07945 [Aestuariivirga sp.]